MREAYAGTADRPNGRGARSCADLHASCIQSSIIDLIKIKNVRKPWAFLADVCGLSERSAKSRIAGARAFTVEELQSLLQSDDGLDFLVAVMADARPRWWVWALKVMKLADVRRRQHEDQQEVLRLETDMGAEVGARRRIRNALNANADLSASLARAETALGLQRADMDRREDHAVRANGRVAHRPVAQKGGRR